MIVIYNDGEVAVHFLNEDGDIGTIQRVFKIEGKITEQATREDFLADLPVTESFILDVRQDEEAWTTVQRAIAAGLRGRGIKYTPEKWTATA